MGAPTFPIPLHTLPASIQFNDFEAGERFTLDGDIDITTAALAHPNEATAYRIQHGGSSVCYVTDTEHVQGRLDAAILTLIQGSDLVIYDSTYTDSEYTTRFGWGHSTWQEGVRLAKAAGTKQLAIFHHDPDHDDQFMDQVAAEAKAMWSGAFVATEGAVVALNE